MSHVPSGLSCWPGGGENGVLRKELVSCFLRLLITLRTEREGREGCTAVRRNGGGKREREREREEGGGRREGVLVASQQTCGHWS